MLFVLQFLKSSILPVFVLCMMVPLWAIFFSSCGVCQGDVLSSILFCHAKDFLSHYLSKHVQDLLFLPMLFSQDRIAPSHFSLH